LDRVLIPSWCIMYTKALFSMHDGGMSPQNDDYCAFYPVISDNFMVVDLIADQVGALLSLRASGHCPWEARKEPLIDPDVS